MNMLSKLVCDQIEICKVIVSRQIPIQVHANINSHGRLRRVGIGIVVITFIQVGIQITIGIQIAIAIEVTIAVQVTVAIPVRIVRT